MLPLFKSPYSPAHIDATYLRQRFWASYTCLNQSYLTFAACFEHYGHLKVCHFPFGTNYITLFLYCQKSNIFTQCHPAHHLTPRGQLITEPHRSSLNESFWRLCSLIIQCFLFSCVYDVMLVSFPHVIDSNDEKLSAG